MSDYPKVDAVDWDVRNVFHCCNINAYTVQIDFTLTEIAAKKHVSLFSDEVGKKFSRIYIWSPITCSNLYTTF